MYELSNPAVIKRLLTDAGFSFKKSLGQNFLIDPSVCPEMAAAAFEAGNSLAVEIGPGVGVLTVELANRFEKVVTVELDERLRPVLKKTLASHPNTEVVWGDAMKIDLAELIRTHSKNGVASVAANLPYYITSPIVMMLLESRLPITDITVMVQKEAAERICAEIGSREAGVLTVSVRYYAEPRGRQCRNQTEIKKRAARKGGRRKGVFRLCKGGLRAEKKDPCKFTCLTRRL